MIVTTEALQKRLADLGYDPGPTDGVRGRRTIAAIREFQADHGLLIDGIAGPATRAKLFSGPSGMVQTSRPDRPWYEEARRFLGLKEVEGQGNNRIIMDWATDLDLAYPGDEIPWCGLFAAHCIGATLPGENLPGGVLMARNWQRFGRSCGPTLGCVLVFWRTDRTRSSNGHVGFYAGEDRDAYYVLGGNQSNAVNVVRIARTRLLAARWPSTAPFGETRITELAPTSDALSIEEA